MTTPTLIEAARAARNALGNLIDAQNGPPLIDQADEWDCAMHEAHAAIDALRAAIEAAESAQPEPARQPMTAGEFSRLMLSLFSTTKHRVGAMAFGLELVRAVERHHRIGNEETTR